MPRLQIPKAHDFILKLCAQAGVTLRRFKHVKEFEREVIQFMKHHDILCLATSRNDTPRCTPLGYFTQGLTVHILSEGGGKFANLKANQNVAYSIASRIKGGRGLMRVRGLQVWGKAHIISMKRDQQQFEEILILTGIMKTLGRRGIGGLPPFHYRFIKIEPERIRYLNLSRGINNVTWVRG
jgi:uncharacterized pyridoxamine 5'-phosphate oxidase family protein